MADPHPASASLGFLTVCEHEGGLFGGYLVLNLSGRPLEFHCTAPVRPSRTQAILYGPTLKPYLYGEQIGQALLEKAKSPPLIVFTDVPPAMTVRDFIVWPVAYVPPADDAALLAAALPAAAPPTDSSFRCDAAHPGPPGPTALRLHRFSLGPLVLGVSANHLEDESAVVERWRPHCAEFDLREPFNRIRDAIDEARRSVR